MLPSSISLLHAVVIHIMWQQHNSTTLSPREIVILKSIQNGTWIMCISFVWNQINRNRHRILEHCHRVVIEYWNIVIECYFHAEASCHFEGVEKWCWCMYAQLQRSPCTIKVQAIAPCKLKVHHFTYMLHHGVVTSLSALIKWWHDEHVTHYTIPASSCFCRSCHMLSYTIEYAPSGKLIHSFIHSLIHSVNRTGIYVSRDGILI